MKTPSPKIMAAFWRQVGNREGDPCWNWKGERSGDGAPVFRVGRQAVSAARFLYEAMVAKLPAGQHLVQTCGNAGCVNSEHQQLQRDSAGQAVTACDTAAA